MPKRNLSGREQERNDSADQRKRKAVPLFELAMGKVIQPGHRSQRKELTKYLKGRNGSGGKPEFLRLDDLDQFSARKVNAAFDRTEWEVHLLRDLVVAETGVVQ